jgi:hypothetical protein
MVITCNLPRSVQFWSIRRDLREDSRGAIDQFNPQVDGVMLMSAIGALKVCSVLINLPMS